MLVTDTVSIRTARLLLPAISRAICAGNPEPSPDWVFEWNVKPRSDATAIDPTRLKGWHKPSGLYVGGNAEIIKYYSGSLPRQRFGHNGIQLKTDAETAQAHRRAVEILNEISEEPLIGETLSRLDVCVNIHHAEPERLVRALRNARHPWIRSETEKYAYGSIRLQGTGANLIAYWKQRAQRCGDRRPAWQTPGVLRLELQLKDVEKITRFLGHEAPPLPPFPPRAELYQALRQFMLGFPRREQIEMPCDMPALLALCEANDLHLPGGEDVMSWHRRSVGDSGHRKMRTKVAGVTARLVGIDWAEIFPSDRIPRTVDVHRNGMTVVIPEQQLVTSP